MAFEVRNLRDEAEMEAAELISAQGFGGPHRFDMAPHMERVRRLYAPEQYLGAFEDGALTAMMRIIPLGMRINGAALPFGVVSPVASSPLHRRKGHAGAMLRRSLEQMRERGQVLSGLYTPHPALYRRYGWEIAGAERYYAFAPKDLSLAVQPSQRGRLRFVKPDDWRDLDAVFRQHARLANGQLERDEFWWREWVLRSWTGPLEGVIWQSQTGVDEGYLLYMDERPRPGEIMGRIHVSELVALSSDAYLNLLTVLGQNDIRESVEVRAPLDDPLPLLFQDADRISMREEYTVLLRIVDVAEALRQRPLADPSLEVELSLAVTDGSAPWNQGTWRVRTAEGRTTVEATDAPAELRIDALHLAPLFNGYVSPRRAVQAGLLRVENEEALAKATALFATLQPPHFTDRF